MARPLAEPSPQCVRGALAQVAPQIAGDSIAILPSITVRPQWCRATAIVDGRFAVKFAWTNEAAEVLSKEIAVQRMLRASSDVRLAPFIASSDEPTMIVSEVVDGRPLTYDDASGLDRGDRERLAQAFAVEVAAVHDAAVLAAASAGALGMGTATPQAWPDELRRRLPQWAHADLWRRTEQLLVAVEAVLARPCETVVVHGDLHGYNLIVDERSTTVRAVLDFADSGLGDRSFDFRYLPRQADTLALFDAVIAAYERLTSVAVDRARALAWHVLTDLGDALWRTETATPVVAGPIDRRIADLFELLEGSALV